jgi:DeoR/GlpR family transcriptional regulator of sugar metabolism
VPRNPRHDTILAILANRRSVNVAELTERLSVSEVTVRKDLALLEDAGHLVRTRGGATIAEDRERIRSVQVRRRESVGPKRWIASRAASLVRDGETIFIDSGSSCALLAELLVDRDLRVVTNSLDVITALRDAEGIQLYSVGGSFRRDALSFIGPTALANLAGFHFDTAFLGTTGFSEAGVLSAQNVNEAEVKRAAIAAASRNVVLCDSSKFGTQAFAAFAQPQQINLVIMDVSAPVNAAVRALGMEVITASEADCERSNANAALISKE